MKLNPVIRGDLAPPSGTFEAFLEAHPLYRAAFESLSANSRILETSSQLVYELHGDALGPVANDILSFVTHAYAADYIDRYIARLNRLAELQRRFDRNPSVSTLGDSGAVKSEAYSLALLLSIVLTNHRFEIMDALSSFLESMNGGSAGVAAFIGAGTGYELKLAAQLLPDWTIEAYDTDAEIRTVANDLLTFFAVSKAVDFQIEFPLENPTPEVLKRYDAVVLCEVLEHLPDPLRALQTLRACLTDTGRMFVTMAINIAQEDHVFLYPDIESCRRQIREAELQIVQEWISPQTIFMPPVNREQGFKKGNYMAVVEKRDI